MVHSRSENKEWVDKVNIYQNWTNLRKELDMAAHTYNPSDVEVQVWGSACIKARDPIWRKGLEWIWVSKDKFQGIEWGCRMVAEEKDSEGTWICLDPLGGRNCKGQSEESRTS
jgi:hypothetical protein